MSQVLERDVVRWSGIVTWRRLACWRDDSTSYEEKKKLLESRIDGNTRYQILPTSSSKTSSLVATLWPDLDPTQHTTTHTHNWRSKLEKEILTILRKKTTFPPPYRKMMVHVSTFKHFKKKYFLKFFWIT